LLDEFSANDHDVSHNLAQHIDHLDGD